MLIQEIYSVVQVFIIIGLAGWIGIDYKLVLLDLELLITVTVLYEVPWSIGLGGITVYLLGVSQAIAQVE